MRCRCVLSSDSLREPAMAFRLTRAITGFTRLCGLGWVMVVASLEFGLNPRHRRDLAGRARWLHRGCRQALSALKVKLPAPSIRRAPALIVTNHLSYLDILVLSAMTPAVFF